MFKIHRLKILQSLAKRNYEAAAELVHSDLMLESYRIAYDDFMDEVQWLHEKETLSYRRVSSGVLVLVLSPLGLNVANGDKEHDDIAKPLISKAFDSKKKALSEGQP